MIRLKGKSGMATWQIVLLVLAILLLIFVVGWYAGLNQEIKSLLSKFINLI
jgi:hypothetical protein